MCQKAAIEKKQMELTLGFFFVMTGARAARISPATNNKYRSTQRAG